ncbi:unnamed protein product, partial [Mesorhabditis belari]|uniref:Spectrin beta chain n=1 Tax=Mesorhabditis belari TaxID=2138241 RepID=A0AAF3F2J7_9BILA
MSYSYSASIYAPGHQTGKNERTIVNDRQHQDKSDQTTRDQMSNRRHYDIPVRIPRPGGAPTNGGNLGAVPSPRTFEEEDFTNETLYFERNRIKQLQDERVHIQKKTFTKWCNSFLNRARLEINDLFVDVCDGVMLMKLLEIISGEKLGKPNKGRMRVQKIENLNKVLDFLKKKKIQLENIGAEDILDRNERLILGLIWTIILRFQIDTIVIEDEQETGERKHAKDALLLWCQRKTAGYRNVKVENFTSSWRSGLAFNALIHAHRPDLLNYDGLNPNDHMGNLNNAFDIAEKKLDIARLLDAEDIDVARPDEKSIITYVSLYYHYFAKQKSEMTGAKRVANIVGKLMSQEQMEDDYEAIVSDLLEWIKQTIVMLNNRKFPNSLKGIQEEMVRFNHFRNVEKPPKYKEKGELEALFFNIQTKRKAMGRGTFVPHQGLFMKDVESSWERLDRAENDRQTAIINEMLRQQKLEQLAAKFLRKAELREHWLNDMSRHLDELELGRTASDVEAALKKHQAISADILPREERFKILSKMCAELTTENYHEADRIRAREREILEKWAHLLSVLETKRKQIMGLNELMGLLRDIDTLGSELKHLEPVVRNRDVGKHILGVDDLIGRHELVEGQVNAHGAWLGNVTRHAQTYIRGKGEQYEILQRKLEDVSAQYDNLVSLCQQRRAALYKARELFQFIQDHEEEMTWLAEKEALCQNAIQKGDVANVVNIGRLHKTVESEMKSHWTRSKEIMAAGERTLYSETPALPSSFMNGQNREDVQKRIQQIQAKWEALRRVVDKLAQWLQEAERAQQYFQDANEAESWIREKMPLVKSDDYGKDEGQAESLLNRHNRLAEEINAFRSDIVRLEESASQLGSSSLFTNGNSLANDSEELLVPQVEMLYKYEGNGMKVKKEEVVALLDKTNSDWWCVLKQDGSEGYVPANYCRIVPGESVTIAQSAASGSKAARHEGDGKKEIQERQQMISQDYRKLNKMAEIRRRLLSDNIKLMRFFRECDEFENWAQDTITALSDEPSVEHVEAFRKKLDKLEHDIAANGGTQLKRINTMADELSGEGHSQSHQITARQEAMNKIWAEIEKLFRAKAHRLSTLEQLADFNANCADVESWMKGKFDILDRKPQDLKSLQNLERDLKPLEEKIRALENLADHVKASNPEMAALIQKRINELKAIHSDLLNRARQKIMTAEETQGQEMFDNALLEMHKWIEKTKKELNDMMRPIDVQTAEDMLKKHSELGEQIKDKKYEVEYVHELGKRLLDKNPRLNVVREKLGNLQHAMEEIRGIWSAKNAYLKQQLDLQLFNREAERIDAVTKGHEAFLDFKDLGDSVESVENLLKRHRDLEAKLDAQRPRLDAFNKNADELIRVKHPDEGYVHKRRDEVLARREAVRRAAAQRRALLEASMEYQSLRRDGDEMLGWIADKKKIATDDAHLDLHSIEIKLLKHEAFEAEIKANTSRIEHINKDGAMLISRRHYETPNIERLVDRVNTAWAGLKDASARKGEKLRQAADQKSLNDILDDANAKLDELDAALQNKDVGNDLRGVKDLIQRHTTIEQELRVYEDKLQEISSKGSHMAEQGHFDSERITKTVKNLLNRFEKLTDPCAARRAALEESLKWHQLAFDVDCELQWIAEKVPIAASEETGRTLTEALNMARKQEQLEAEVNQHAPHIEETVHRGEELIKRKHTAQKEIKGKCEQLAGAWTHLQQLVKRRKWIVEWGVKEQQYLFDATEVESWMAEKRILIESQDHGQDEDAAQKLLAKHKALQNDMSTYRQWVERLAVKCNELVSSKRPNVERFTNKQRELEEEFERLAELAEKRRHLLEDTLCLHAYLRESADLEQWINEQLQTAMSEEYGDDYEHLKELQARFAEFRQSVKTGSERFVSCELAANSILKRNTPFAREVLKRQERLRSVWTLLVEYMESREQKLKAAEELHRFNRDVAEHEQSVAERLNGMPNDLGRDVKQVQSLRQSHETFEKQLTEMRTQLDKLLQESARLKEAYPGGNAEHISQQQVAMTEGWEELEQATLNRKYKLRAAYDFHRFMGEVRDLLSWCDLIVSEMQTEQHLHDLQGAQWLKEEHARLQSEIETRKPAFAKIDATGREMIAAEHYASDEIRARLHQVDSALKRLHSEWSLRESYLAQVVQWHSLQREAKQILSAIQSKRNTLKQLAVGGNVQEVEAQKKRLETFAKALVSLDDRVQTLDKTARGLIEGRHFESKNIEAWRTKVHESLVALKNEIAIRRKELDAALDEAKFGGDVRDMETWITEKIQAIRVEAERQGQCTTIEDKMKRLQRHQAFEAELDANRDRVKAILDHGQSLQRGPNGRMVTEQCARLSQHWKDLEALCIDQSRALEEARDLLRFKQLVDRVFEWIRDKESMLHAADMGNDMEHCNILIDQLDGTTADNSVDEHTLKELNELGDKLVQQGRSSQKEVHEQKTKINRSWQTLQSDIRAYRQQLKAALEVHKFNRDVDDSNERIHEKTLAMKSEDFGRDFATVDQLMRKQVALERDMEVIHSKLAAHDADAQKLLATNPPLKDTILTSLKRLEASWGVLSETAEQRHSRLERAHQLYRYIDSVKKAEQWAANLRVKMTSHKPPKTTSEARLLIQQHHERKAEIDGRQEELRRLHDDGQRLGAEQPEHKGEVQRAHKRVQNSEHQLRQTWEQEKASLTRALDWLLFSDQCALVESWLASKEAALKDHDIGDNLEAVQMLIKKHEAFEETLKTQSEKVENVKKDSAALISNGNDFAVQIEERRDEVLNRYANLLQQTAHRRAILLDNQRFLDFVRSCGELITWINAKLQLAYDESYLDPANLRSKLQKHLAFDSELSENEKRLNAVVDEGHRLIKDNHFSKKEVEEQLAELKGGWDELRQKSALKTQRLREAYDAFTLTRKIDDVEKWLDRIEGELSSEDHGKDVISVDTLVKKLETLQAEVAGRGEHIAEVMSKAKELKAKTGPNNDKLLTSAEEISLRYAQLDEPIKIRRENLNDAKKLFEWEAEANEEYEWLNDRLLLARSTEFGDTMQAAENLSKKHALLEKDLETRQTSLDEVEKKGVAMIRSKHFASSEIQRRMDELMSLMLQMKEACATRRNRLEAAVVAQRYFTEVAEAEQWIRDRLPLAISHETSKDQAGAESQLRRLGILEKDAIKFNDEVKKMKKLAERLVQQDYQDSTQIDSRQHKLEAAYSQLLNEISKRMTQLGDASRYHAYVRQADDLMDWLHEKERAAAAEEYGRDLEECQRLIEEFDIVVRELSATGERVANVRNFQEELLRAGHPFAASIRAKGEDLSRLWQSVNEIANERQQALAGAKQVHRFDQEADETINWLQEKEADGVALENVELAGADLNTLTSERQRLEEFIHGLKAVEKQVTELCREADRLEALFPYTKQHLEGRKMEMTMLLNDIMESANKHQERLKYTEQLQSYFQEHRELISWVKRLFTTITAESLPKDVGGSEALATRHNEYYSEMMGRRGNIDSFCTRGRNHMQQGHVLSSEIERRVDQLERAYSGIQHVWKERHELYLENMDVQQWKANANALEQWMVERENLLGDDWRHIDSVATADEKLRDFDDFLVTVNAQGERCEGVRRMTLLEKNFSKQLQREAERVRVDQEESTRRRDTIKVVEKGNLLANRRQERERRKTQEISLMKPSGSGEDFSSQTLPRKLDGQSSQRRERSKTTALGEPVVSVSGPSTLPILAPGQIGGGVLIPQEEMPQTSIQTVTPGFSTRRAASVRRSSSHRWADDMSQIDMTGYVDRKQELQSGGKRATLRSWKNYYTILCGQLICFFKDEDAFTNNIAASPPVYIHNAECQQYPEYAKRKHAFKLITQDGAEYLFACNEERQMLEWVAKIKFHATLPPSAQLTAFSRETSAHETTSQYSGSTAPIPAPRSSSYSNRSGDILRRQHEMGASQSTDSDVDPSRRASQLSNDFGDSQRSEMYRDQASTQQSHTSNNGHEQQERARYERIEATQKGSEGTEFISWVEQQNASHQSSSSGPHNGGHSETDDESVKGTKRRGFSSLFSRSSKKSNK